MLRSLMAEVLGEDPESFHDDFGPSHAARWDSLAGLRIVAAIEDAFDVRFTMEEIQQMATFGAILRTLRSKSRG